MSSILKKIVIRVRAFFWDGSNYNLMLLRLFCMTREGFDLNGKKLFCLSKTNPGFYFGDFAEKMGVIIDKMFRGSVQ